MRDLSRGAEPDRQSGGKVRSRTSQPNLSSGSKPSVPSLPSIQRTSSPVPSPIAAQQTGPRGFVTPSRQLGSKPPTGPGGRPAAMPIGYPVPPMQANPVSPIGQMPMGQVGPMGHMAHGHAGQLVQIARGQVHHGHAQAHGQMGHHGQPANPINAMGHAGHLSGNLPNSPYSFGHSPTPTLSPPKSNALVFVLIAVLIAAIAVLAYLVMTK